MIKMQSSLCCLVKHHIWNSHLCTGLCQSMKSYKFNAWVVLHCNNSIFIQCYSVDCSHMSFYLHILKNRLTNVQHTLMFAYNKEIIEKDFIVKNVVEYMMKIAETETNGHICEAQDKLIFNVFHTHDIHVGRYIWEWKLASFQNHVHRLNIRSRFLKPNLMWSTYLWLGTWLYHHESTTQ